MNFLKTYSVFIFFCITTHFVCQENFKNEEEKIKFANKLFEKNKFIEAESHIQNLLSNNNNSEYNFKYGVCILFKYADKSKSIPYLKKAIKDPNVDSRAFFYLARVYHYNYLFQDALNNYNKFKSLCSAKAAKALKLDMYIKMSKNGKSLMQNLSDIVVIDKKTTSLDKFNYSYNLTDIGGKILVTEEFQSKLDKKNDHKPIIYFPPFDQDILFYSSYGESGNNGLDIYYKKRLPGGGWSESIILPESLNTEYDDDYPFLNSDATTFYFSSMGHNSMGGFDIFRSSFDKSNNSFGPVINLDYKINSTDDDLLYIVDKENTNAIFSSKRSSEGGMIDVYNVKVKVLPLQNIVISGIFSNKINPNDFKATIKVQDITNNKLIGSYIVNNEYKYNMILPNSGTYKFIVETPESQKIHTGLVEVPLQTKLKVLKQEIELINKDGEEKLIIKDYFDQSPEDEDVILANILKEMSEPEINIDQYPDSILDKIVQNQPKKANISNENNLTNGQREELNSTDIFIANKNEILILNQETLKSFKQQKILVSNIAKLNFEDSKKNAKKADSILIDLESEENIDVKNSKLELAAEFNAKSMILNQQSTNAITLSKKIDYEISQLEDEIDIIGKLQSKDELASNNNNYDLKIIESINESFKDPSKKDNPSLNNINDQVSNLEFREKSNKNNIELVQKIDLDKIKIDNNNIKTNLIEKNKPQLEIIKIDSAKISNELFDNSNVNNDLAVNSTVNSNESSTVKSEETKFLIEDKKTVEFIENLPIDIPMVKSVEKIPSQTINGITFSPEDEPENYEVTSLADPDIDFIQDNYENKINNKIIEINIKNIDKIRELSSQLDNLKLQKLDLSTEKEISKIDKQIKKILKTRAKTELKVVDDMAYVNENEINHLFREISSLKNQQGSEYSPNFKSKQAQAYEKAANDLFVESKLLREKASLGSDTSYFLTEFKIHKVDLIEHAIKNENTAIKYLSKSKELYAESLTEGFSDDIISIAKSISTQQKKQSVRLEELSEISMNESVEYSKKAIFFEEEGDILKSKEYEDLAEIQKNKSISYKQESLNYKKKESNLVQDIEISNSLVDTQSLEIASTKDFKSYYEFQKAIKNLDLESQKLNYKNQSYLKLSQQMNAKADALEQKSKLESDPVTKNELLKLSNSFKNQAKINKELSNALVITMDSVKREIKSKQMSQALIIDMMSSNEKTQIKALAISGKADSILSILSNDKLTEISDSISSDSVSLDSIYIDPIDVDSLSNQGLVLEDSISSINSKSNVEVTSNGFDSNNILSKDFIPPVIIDENIFIFTQKQVYSDANPIPFNPKIPNGLIFKVQVGAFRNPIPQDLFKGFAPISAERVRDDITRYRVGYFKTFESANKAKNQIRLLGYSDAFVVSINNGERIKLNEARNIQQSDPSIDISSNSIINSNASENNNLSDLRTKIANDNSLAPVITVDQIKGVFFSVQIGAFSKPLTKENSYNISPLIVSKVNNLYKYSTGEYKSIEFALIKKADLINDNILPDAFIIAYKNGVKISLDQARSYNPNREVVYENPIIYYIDFGTYPVYKTGQFIGEPLPNTDFPEKLNEETLDLRDLNIKSRSRFGGKQFFSKKFNSLSDAQKALNLVENLDISNAQILKSKRDDFAFNYEYKIEISNPNSNDDTFISKLDKLKNLAFKEDGENIYYSKSRDDYESATTDLNACKSQNLEDSRIVVFKNGVETNLEQTLKNFK